MVSVVTLRLGFSVGVATFVIGPSQISPLFSQYQHKFPAAVWSVVIRFPSCGCFKCHYYLIRVPTWLCARFLNTTESLFASPLVAFVCRCVITVQSNFFVALFVLSLCPFDISVDIRVFVIGRSLISSFSLNTMASYTLMPPFRFIFSV